MSARLQSLPSEHHVVLVHGTWGHGVLRAWFWRFVPEAQRAREIDWPTGEALRAQGCIVHSFTWSGKNTHAAREAAGKELAQFIAAKVPPGRQLSVIAHSHGGAVACYALPGLAGAHLGSLIFLATPFLHFRPQKLDTSGFKLLPWAFLYVFFGIGIGIPLFIFADKLHRDDPTAQPGWAGVCAVLVLAVSLGYLGFRLAKLIVAPFEKLEDRLKKLGEAHQPPVPPAQATLILRNIADEAQGAITTGGALEWLLAKLWGALSWLVGIPGRLADDVRQKHKDHPVAMAFFWLGLLALGWLLVHFFEDEMTLLWAFGLASAVVAIVAVCALQTVFMLLILGLNFLRFGAARDFIGTAFLQVVSEPAPIGAWQVEIFPGGGFAHSEIHQNEKVTARIVERIRQTEGKSNAVV